MLTERILKLLAEGPATSAEIRDTLHDAAETTVLATITNLRADGRITVIGKVPRPGKGNTPNLYALAGTKPIVHEKPKREETPLPANGEYRMAGRITVRQIVFPGSRLGHKHIGLP